MNEREGRKERDERKEGRKGMKERKVGKERKGEEKEKSIMAKIRFWWRVGVRLLTLTSSCCGSKGLS